METAEIALVLSLTSACITLGGLIWQVTLYRLSGARLRVQLVFEFRDDVHRVFAQSGARRQTWQDSVPDVGEPEYFGIECVRVRVTNIGRSPVAVENVALDTGRSRRWGRGRKSVVPWSFQDIDSSDPEAKDPSTGPVRLEAGATASRIYLLWPVVTHETERGDGEVTIRGTATAAGRRPTLSPRRFAWKFKAGDDTWFLDHEVTPELRVYRELARHGQFDHVGGLPNMMHREVSEQLRGGASVEDIKAFLLSMQSDGIFGIVAYDAHKAFHADRRSPSQ